MTFSFRVLLIASVCISTLAITTTVSAQDDCMDIYGDPEYCGGTSGTPTKYSQSGYQTSKESIETAEESEPDDCMDIYGDPEYCGESSSPSKYGQSSYKTSTTNAEDDCGLCIGETIARATQAIRDTVVSTAKDALSLGESVLERLGVVDDTEPTFAELPDLKKTTTSESEVLRMIAERNRVNTTPATDDSEDEDIGTPSPTSVATIPVFTKQQQEALDAARGLGLDTKSPAVEAVVLSVLETTGSPAESTAAIKEIIASTGGNINQAITVNAAFGLASCGTRECQIAEELRELAGLDPAEYQLALTREMRDVDNRRQGIIDPTSSDDCIDIYGDSETCGTPAPFPQYGQSAYITNDPEDYESDEPYIQPIAGPCDAGIGCFRMENVDVVPSTFQRDTLTLFSPTSLFYTGGTDDRIIPPTLTTLSLSHVRGVNMTTEFINNAAITIVSASSTAVDTLNLYATANMNPLINDARSFTPNDEFESARAAAEGRFVPRDDDLKVILPAGQIAYGTYRGFPVMSPGELFLAGRLDLSRGGRFDPEAELAALELVLNGEAPASTLQAIRDGRATNEDLIELSGIITTVVNRSIAADTSLQYQIFKPLQFSSVTQDRRAFSVDTPNLDSVVRNLANGTYAQELGLNSFALDEFAYATHYYSPAGIRYQTGTRSTPGDWDIDFTSPSYVSEGGHIFGNVFVSNGRVHEFAVTGRALPLAPSNNGITALAYANTTATANAPFITLLTPVPPARIPTLTEDCGLMCKLTIGFLGGPEAARKLVDEYRVAQTDRPIVPITGNMQLGHTAEFGDARGRLHAGVDLYAQPNDGGYISGPHAEVIAAMGGEVRSVRYSDTYGQVIDILGDDGIWYRYAHTARTNPYDLEVGTRVETGEPITFVTGSGTVFGRYVDELVADNGGNLERALRDAEDHFNEVGWGATALPHLHLETRSQFAYGATGAIDPHTLIPELEDGGTFVAGTGANLLSLEDAPSAIRMAARYLPEVEVPPTNTNPRPIIGAVTEVITDTVTNVVDFFGGLFDGDGGTPNDTDEKPTELPDTSSPTGKLSIADIVSVTIHLGLDVKCPNLKGVSQNGYVYTVVLKNTTKSIERTGCGVGTPDTFAKAIAIDLMERNGFTSLRSEDLAEKITFKFYSAEVSVKN